MLGALGGLGSLDESMGFGMGGLIDLGGSGNGIDGGSAESSFLRLPITTKTIKNERNTSFPP